MIEVWRWTQRKGWHDWPDEVVGEVYRDAGKRYFVGRIEHRHHANFFNLGDIKFHFRTTKDACKWVLAQRQRVLADVRRQRRRRR